MLNLMWTSTTKHQFGMRLKIQYQMRSSFIDKNTQKNCTKRNADANICKSYRTWIIDDIPTILRHHKNHRFHYIAMMTLVQSMIMPRNRQITQKPLLEHCTIFRDKHQGMLLWQLFLCFLLFLFQFLFEIRRAKIQFIATIKK